MNPPTKFQLRLKSYCWGMSAKEGHWFLASSAPRLIRPPNYRTITTKRAIYAAFFGDIADGMELREACGAAGCVCPEHQLQHPCRKDRQVRGVHLPDLWGEAAASAVQVPARKKLSAPRNVGAETPGGAGTQEDSEVVAWLRTVE